MKVWIVNSFKRPPAFQLPECMIATVFESAEAAEKFCADGKAKDDGWHYQILTKDIIKPEQEETNETTQI